MDLSSMVQWVSENWMTVLTLAYLALNLLNGVLALVPGDQESWIPKVRAVLDRLSVLTNSNAAGTVKLPLTTSKPPTE